MWRKSHFLDAPCPIDDSRTCDQQFRTFHFVLVLRRRKTANILKMFSIVHDDVQKVEGNLIFVILNATPAEIEKNWSGGCTLVVFFTIGPHGEICKCTVVLLYRQMPFWVIQNYIMQKSFEIIQSRCFSRKYIALEHPITLGRRYMDKMFFVANRFVACLKKVCRRKRRCRSCRVILRTCTEAIENNL